ncbi:MAG: nucleotidyltransferase family protein [Desulfobulbus sp.]|nr:MAG: nucleotidyltransferase family protein [Desulfobulbus sp.]
MQVMLLAAGFGTRLRPYTLLRPKPLFPVLNRPLLLVLIEMLRSAGVDRLVVNGHHLREMIARILAPQPDVLFQEEPVILGTGGSLREALPHLADEPLLVMNGDILHTVDVAALYRRHLESGNAITMALHDLPRFNSVQVDETDILSFRPAPDGAANLLAYTGIQVVNPEIIAQIPAGRFVHIIDLYEELCRKGGRIGYVRVDGCFWRDIGTPEDYLGLHEELLTGKQCYPMPLSRPAGSWLISPEAVIAEGTRFSGWGCIGRAEIASGVTLHNCVVWDGARIPAGACLHDAIVV